MIALVVILRKVRDMPFVGAIETSTSVGAVPARVLGGYVQPTSPHGSSAAEHPDEQTLQLLEEADGHRSGLSDDPKQVDELLALYHRFVDKGLPFPLDLEEHTLRLILKFLRPDDQGAADRLRDVVALRASAQDGAAQSHPQATSAPNSAEHGDALEGEAARLRQAPDDGVDLIEAIQALYSRYQATGRSFPLDLEEKSLRLILKLMRPHDESVRRRLAAVLRLQGKPVSDGIVGEQKYALEDVAALRLEPAGDGLPPSPSERLIFVMGLPKSASRMTTDILAAAHPDSRYRKKVSLPYTTGYAGLDATADLRYDGLVAGDVGGIVHSHAAATTNTRQTLAYLGVRHVITVRHPADHVAALYCHLRRTMTTAPSEFVQSLIKSKGDHGRFSDPSSYYQRYTEYRMPNDLYWHYVIFPLDPHYFIDSDDIDAALSHMLGAGYLFHALSWMASWQLLRVRNISTIVRFEDLIGSPEVTIRQMLGDVFQQYDDDAVARGLGAMRSADAVQPDARIYPRGYTGGVGIWKQYFASENRDLYNSVCDNFVRTHPYGKLLTELYGDLEI